MTEDINENQLVFVSLNKNTGAHKKAGKSEEYRQVIYGH
jgi:hypothetical protein